MCVCACVCVCVCVCACVCVCVCHSTCAITELAVIARGRVRRQYDRLGAVSCCQSQYTELGDSLCVMANPAYKESV